MESPQFQSPAERAKAKKATLTFEPITDGLGFHPFSDGLPYAPMSKTPTPSNMAAAAKAAALSSGAGAVAAGLPGYQPPPPALPRIQAPRVPVATPVSPPAAAPVVARAPQPMANPGRIQTHAPAPKAAAPVAQAAAAARSVNALGLTPEQLQPTFGFVYLFKRVFAYLIDSLFNLGLCAGALSVALWKQDLNPELLLSPGIVLVAGLFLGFFNWAITTAEEVAFGTSIGKRMFGLAIQGGASAIFLRAFFFIPGVCFGGIGLLWALFDRRRRCWHDLVVDLQPIEIARL